MSGDSASAYFRIYSAMLKHRKILHGCFPAYTIHQREQVYCKNGDLSGNRAERCLFDYTGFDDNTCRQYSSMTDSNHKRISPARSLYVKWQAFIYQSPTLFPSPSSLTIKALSNIIFIIGLSAFYKDNLICLSKQIYLRLVFHRTLF